MAKVRTRTNRQRPKPGWVREDPIYGVTWVYLYCPLDQIPHATAQIKGLSKGELAGLMQHVEAGFRDAHSMLGGKTLWSMGGHVGWIVVWVNPSVSCVPATVAHECLHGVAVTLADRGLRMSNDSDEAYTYYLGWAVEGWYEGVGK